MNEQFTPELLAQARTAETPEALLALAKEHGIPLTPEEAQARFDQLHQNGALSDEELDNVAGGGCGETKPLPRFDVGDIVSPSMTTAYFRCNICGEQTRRAKVVSVEYGYYWSVDMDKCWGCQVSCPSCSNTNSMVYSETGKTYIPDSEIRFIGYA